MIPVYPPIVLNRDPGPVQCARELFGFSQAWCPLALTRRGTDFIIRGAVYLTVIERGRYAGDIDFNRPEPGSERAVKLLGVSYRAWLLRWEAETGFCSTCKGSGQAFARWDKTQGYQYHPCPRCSASGKAPQVKGSAAA